MIPQTPAAILFEARGFGRTDGRAAGPMVGGTDFNSATSSGKELAGFHSAAPSVWTRVSARMRFSAIHRRICSRLTGPYCWPSAPMILYIARLSFWNEPATVCGICYYILGGGFVMCGGGMGGAILDSLALTSRSMLMLVTRDHSHPAPKNKAPATR